MPKPLFGKENSLLRVDSQSALFALALVLPIIGLILAVLTVPVFVRTFARWFPIAYVLYGIALLCGHRYLLKTAQPTLMRIAIQAAALIAILTFASTFLVAHLAPSPVLALFAAALQAPYYFLLSAVLIAGCIALLYQKRIVIRDVAVIFLFGIVASVLSTIDVVYRWSLTPLQDTYLVHLMAGMTAVLYWYTIQEWTLTNQGIDGLTAFAWFGGIMALLQVTSGVVRTYAETAAPPSIEAVILSAASILVYFGLLYLIFRTYRPRPARTK
ncbi:MAG TPA: hypothetical protein VGN17_04925 [Bryobacteraceae bacterium]|jgi:hypothetical protein